MTGQATPSPPTYAGFPLDSWFFAIRIWVSMMAALYVSFWLQLESASSAAVCVGILALPTRGQAYQKAIYRFGGTVVGGIASVLIAGLFNGQRELFILAFAGWLALCVYGASLLDGNRAYGVVLSGYTVAVVAVAAIDAPQTIFSAAINRGAANAVGIASLMLFNDLFRAPDVFPNLLGRLEDGHRRVRGFVRGALLDGDPDPAAVTALLKSITALRPDVTALPSESITGEIRAAGARTAIAAMVREVAAARAAGAVLSGLGAEGRQRAAMLAAAVEEGHGPAATAVDGLIAKRLSGGDATSPEFLAASISRILLEQNRRTAEALEDLRCGRGPLVGPALPLFRSREAALRSALRVFLAIVIAATVLILSGWPATNAALTLLGATCGLSATNPNPKQFAKGAVIAMPIAAALAGITKYVILGGVDAFPQLAIALAPGVIGAALVLRRNHPLWSPVGFLVLVFLPALLGPSNPQNYDPISYLTGSLFAILGVIGLFLVLMTVLPTTDASKRRWILGSIRRDFQAAVAGLRPRMSPESITFREAERIGQLDGLAADPDRTADLRQGLISAAMTSAALRLRAALAGPGLPPGTEPDGQAALEAHDPVALRRVAQRIVDREGTGEPGESGTEARHWAAATLVWMAALMEREPAILGELDGEPVR